jgi:Predicted membrane protein
VIPSRSTRTGPAKLDLALSGDGGLLVTQTAWRAGWRARVDGRPATVLRVGGAMCGVVVPPASTTVTLYYRPDGWIRGQQIFVAGMAAWLLLVTLAARRRGSLQRRERSP